MRARTQRQEAAQAAKRERDERRAGKLAAREAAVRESEAARVRAEEAKGERKRAREREKAAHARRRARIALRGRIKQKAVQWLNRVRPGGQTT